MINDLPQSFVFYYSPTIKLETKQKNFGQAIDFVLARHEPTEFTPYKMVITSTGKTLYFDEGFFKEFNLGNISKQELIELTECDGLFRNKEEIGLIGKLTIDAGSLFKRIDDKLILVDDDNYIAIEYPDANFYEI
jgi:hypothetical protein